MASWPVYGRIDGPVVIIGFGSIGRGILPLIRRHFALDRSQVIVVEPGDENAGLLATFGARHVRVALTRENYREVLQPLLTGGEGQAFCVNLSVDTSSLDIMKLTRELGALYIDTVIEPWPGFYYDHKADPASRSNYALREELLAEKRAHPGGPTAVSCCGANPGMVSWFVKHALLDVARDLGMEFDEPKSRREWAELMRATGVKGIHIAERDTQRSRNPKPLDTSSTPGRSTASSRKGCSRPSSAGARMRNGSPTMPAPTTPARARRSSCSAPAPIRASAPGARRRVRSSAIS